jgi:hypothetical protein
MPRAAKVEISSWHHKRMNRLGRKVDSEIMMTLSTLSTSAIEFERKLQIQRLVCLPINAMPLGSIVTNANAFIGYCMPVISSLKPTAGSKMKAKACKIKSSS